MKNVYPNLHQKNVIDKFNMTKFDIEQLFLIA